MPFSSHEDEEFPIARFESMLKTNDVYFFDATEFENITHHYLDEGKVSKAKKAIQIGLGQHPSSIELKLLQIEIMVFENQLEVARKLLDDYWKLNLQMKKSISKRLIFTLKRMSIHKLYTF